MKRSRSQLELDGSSAEQIMWVDHTLGGGKDVVNKGTKVQLRYIIKDSKGVIVSSSIRGELVRHMSHTLPEHCNLTLALL